MAVKAIPPFSSRDLRVARAFAPAGVLPPAITMPRDLLADGGSARVATKAEALSTMAEVLLDADIDALGALFPRPPAERGPDWALDMAERLLGVATLLGEQAMTMGEVVCPEDAARWRDIASIEKAFFAGLESKGVMPPSLTRKAAARRGCTAAGVEQIVLPACVDAQGALVKYLENSSQEVVVLVHAYMSEAGKFDEWGRPVAMFSAGVAPSAISAAPTAVIEADDVGCLLLQTHLPSCGCFWYYLRMKLQIGSIQRRSKNLYLVTRIDGRSKWISLKTGDFNIAKKRARKLLPPEDSEQAWLEHLSRLGARADLELRRHSALASLTWRNLWDEFMARAAGTISEASETSYERWMRILAEAADELGLLPEDILKKDACAKITARLMGAYISARRMLVFYRRVWSTLGLDRGLWETSGAGTVKPLRRHEHYRRLSLDESRKVHGYLQSRNRDLADMVVIGYSTGLRLSDVAWLEWSEIEADGRFLRVVPNKTHLTKPIPLKIPLTNQVRNLILRRRTSPPDGDPYLFSEDARHRPSRKIAAAFKSCGVFAHGNGRASFHSLRATFISMMDEAGVPPHITDAITGHAGGGMHARYTQPSPQALLAAVKKAIPPL